MIPSSPAAPLAPVSAFNSPSLALLSMVAQPPTPGVMAPMPATPASPAAGARHKAQQISKTISQSIPLAFQLRQSCPSGSSIAILASVPPFAQQQTVLLAGLSNRQPAVTIYWPIPGFGTLICVFPGFS
jgi:hypothetical protein